MGASKASFWEPAWLDELRPKHIAPLIFDISRSKRWSVRKAIQNGAWVDKIRFSNGLTVAHIQEFISLWTLVTQVQLQDNHLDTITWKLTTSGHYSAATAYKAQFCGIMASSFKNTIWKNWAPPKCKFFAWLITQNRV